MSIENPHPNQFSPEKKEQAAFTPESLIAHVRNHESLPNLTDEELQHLNDTMTQAEVVEYHVTVNEFDDREKRREILDRWIPKPKVLYHASPDGDIEEFEPRGKFKRHPEDPLQVYGATTKAIAAMMMAPGGDTWHQSGSYDSGRTHTFIYLDSDEFHAADTGGYIYELPPDTFTSEPDIGLGLGEWTSTKPVKPLGNPEHYSSSIDAMLRHGVTIYPVNSKTFARFRQSDTNHSELLKNLTPLKEI